MLAAEVPAADGTDGGTPEDREEGAWRMRWLRVTMGMRRGRG